MINGVAKKVDIRLFGCDTPARLMCTGTLGHAAKSGCQKCTQVGEYSNEHKKVYYMKEISELRNVCEVITTFISTFIKPFLKPKTGCKGS
jgi:hypothetical protein